MSDLTLDDDRWSGTSFSSFQDGANQKEDLSSRYGLKLVVPVWCAFILLAAVLVVGVVYCSKRHETCRTKRRDGKRSDKRGTKDAEKALTCKEWSGAHKDLEAPSTRETDDMSASSTELSDGNTTSIGSEQSSFDSSVPMPPEITESVLQEGVTNKGSGVPSCAHATCQLCSQKFESGQAVYESNNPKCRHEFHKPCMERWLVCQNTCPICHEPYVLLTV